MAELQNTTIQSPLVMNGIPKYISFAFHRYMERVVLTFAELGIADLMASQKNPVTAAELSQLNGHNWHAEYLYRILRAIADAGIVKELPVSKNDTETDSSPEFVNRFQLTDDGYLLKKDHPSKMRDLVCSELGVISQRQSEYQSHLIQHGLKNGNGFEQAFGCSIFDYMSKPENKQHSDTFNNCMIAYSNYCALSLGSMVDFSRFETIVDLAGGLGSFLSILLAENKNLKGIVFDLPHVIENLRSQSSNQFEEKNIEPSRYEFISGDMFKPETIPKADAYVLRWIIHDWNDEDSIKILQAMRSANSNGESRLITIFIVETILVPNGRQNWIANLMDIEMLIIDAKERTEKQYKQLLKESGYEFKQLYTTDGLLSIIEATATY